MMLFSKGEWISWLPFDFIVHVFEKKTSMTNWCMERHPD